MLSVYFTCLIPLWVTCFQYTQASTPQLQRHARASRLSRSLPCPNAEDIAPCKCENIGGMEMNMICDNIANEDELYNVFHTQIPLPKFHTLTINTSSLETLSESVFGEVTFKKVLTVGKGPFRKGILKRVDPKTFLKSMSTLEYLDLASNEISSFPFDTLKYYKKLTQFRIGSNPINIFPIFESETIETLSFHYTPIKEIPANALDGLSKLRDLRIYQSNVSKFPVLRSKTLYSLDLSYNKITTIPDNAIDGLPSLGHLAVHGNPISRFPIIQRDTLKAFFISQSQIKSIPDGALDGLPNLGLLHAGLSNLESVASGIFKHLVSPLLRLDLSRAKLTHLKNNQFELRNASIWSIKLQNNQISTVDVDAFKGVTRSNVDWIIKSDASVIDMRNNLLQTLPQATWGHLIEAGIVLKLEGNSLTCGCDVAWLVLEPTYHKLVQDATCYDGQKLVELDPQPYRSPCTL